MSTGDRIGNDRGWGTRSRLAERLVRDIQKRISLGHFQPGQQLMTEPQLMAEYQVGRSTVREAIRVLSSNGVVEIRRGIGTFVAETPPGGDLDSRLRRADAVEVYQVRNILEAGIVRLAAENRTAADLRSIHSRLKECEEAFSSGEMARIVEADLAFHLQIAKACGNSALLDVFQHFLYVLRPAYETLMHLPEANRQTLTAFHDNLYSAIKDQDSEGAVRIVQDSIDKLVDELRTEQIAPGGRLPE